MKTTWIIITLLLFSMPNAYAKTLTIKCTLFEISRDNNTTNLSHLEYHYDLMIDFDKEIVSKFIPTQKFFSSNQWFENMRITFNNKTKENLIFERVATNTEYPNQENVYSYLLSNDMKSLIVNIIQYEITSDRKIQDKYSRVYDCIKKT